MNEVASTNPPGSLSKESDKGAGGKHGTRPSPGDSAPDFDLMGDGGSRVRQNSISCRFILCLSAACSI
jgi:hypothetical protein